MNKLQTVVVEVGTGNDKVYRDLLAQLKKDYDVDRAFVDADYYARVQENFATGVVESMGHGAWQTSLAVDAGKSKNWYLFTDHQGGALSSNIRNSGAKKAVNDALKDVFSMRTSAQEIARSVPMSGVQGKLAKPAQELIDAYRRFGGGSSEVTSAMLNLNKYIKQPTSSQNVSGMKQAYNRILRAVEKDESKLLDKAVDTAVNKKIKYINNRMARTEVGRAYNMSRNRTYKEDKRVIGWRWLLSPAHPIFDVCDYCADSNAYGMGSGVYPVGQGPSIPAHPNCLCMSEPVFKRSDRKVGRFSKVREGEAVQSAVKSGYSERRLNKEIQALSNNATNMIPKTLVSER